MPRRLAAILVADIVGYARLMGQDEAGTLSRYTALRETLIDPAVAASGGRIFKAMGDALLVEFASAVEAVTCALTLTDRMTETEESDPLRFRFGIHVGDIIDEDGDLFGDCVNIAARVEAEAEPGGIVLTEDAARHVRGKIGPELADLGERHLKNIDQPQRLFAIGGARRDPTAPGANTGHLPTLAVEPLRHLGDPAQAFVTEGLTDGLSSALAVFNLFDLIDARTEEPDYVLAGTVQIAGPRARIAVSLTEQSNGKRLWGTTYDRSTDDPFTMQDDLIATIASTLGEAMPAEAARALAEKPEADWTAYDYVMDGIQNLHRLDPEGCRLGRAALMRALSIQPGNDVARLILGWISFLESRWMPDPAASRREAYAIVRDLLRRHERSSGAWRLLNRLELRVGNLDAALAAARRAHEINPYDSDIMVNLGTTLAQTGETDAGIPLIERAMRINPYAPSYYAAELAAARLAGGDAEGALAALKPVQRPVLHSRQTEIVVLVELGRLDEAKVLLAELLAEYPDETADRSANWMVGPAAERYRQALIEAGMPTG